MRRHARHSSILSEPLEGPEVVGQLGPACVFKEAPCLCVRVVRVGGALTDTLRCKPSKTAAHQICRDASIPVFRINREVMQIATAAIVTASRAARTCPSTSAGIRHRPSRGTVMSPPCRGHGHRRLRIRQQSPGKREVCSALRWTWVAYQYI